jgi:hypothetical protein
VVREQMMDKKIQTFLLIGWKIYQSENITLIENGVDCKGLASKSY